MKLRKMHELMQNAASCACDSSVFRLLKCAFQVYINSTLKTSGFPVVFGNL